MSDRSRFKIVVAVAFLCLFVATAAVVVSVEAAYMGVLDHSSISATVTDYEMVDGADGPAVEVTVAITNPTPVTVRLTGVSTTVGYLPNSSQPAARVVSSSAESTRVQSGATETITLTLSPTDDVAPVRDAVASERLVVSGAISAQIRSERFDISLPRTEGSP